MSAGAKSDLYGGLPIIPPDAVFKTTDMYKADPRADKMFLSIGAYRDENGKPYVLHVVKKAEERYQKNLLEGKEDKEYDAIAGFKPFRDAAVRLLLGPECPSLDYVASAVTISGTGALRIAASFLYNVATVHTPVYVSNPTWANHHPIFQQTGFHNLRQYRYFNQAKNSLDFQGMLADLTAAPEGSIVIYHICGHNPTGVDPTDAQWQILSDLSAKKKFRIIFDSAYQGYASGSLDRDAFSARLFKRNGLEFITCQSFSKNLGLYGDRVGCLSVTSNSKESASRVQAMIDAVCIRPNYSNPPRRGSRVVHMILTDPVLRKEWEVELKAMSQRIIEMRRLLFNELVRLKTPGTWNHIVDQIGMFSYLGLSPPVCRRMIKEFGIYMLETGRISIAGINKGNVNRLAASIDECLRNPKQESKL